MKDSLNDSRFNQSKGIGNEDRQEQRAAPFILIQLAARANASTCVGESYAAKLKPRGGERQSERETEEEALGGGRGHEGNDRNKERSV